jgi:ubiquinone/menaquinone biosynthesis C-methylase UbiE
MEVEDTVEKQNKLAIPPYSYSPKSTSQHNKIIADFIEENSENADKKVISDFGEEWSKFNEFSSVEINKIGDEYFDILPASLLQKSTTVLDMGCGTGRWTKYLSSKVGFIDAIDPSKAIFEADKLLKDCKNVRLTRATSDALPFANNTFDLVISVGVLHHIPDTLKAMKDCVSRVKPGGYFYTYLYYNLDNRGLFFKGLFKIINSIRRIVANLPSTSKRVVTDVLAVSIYMPPILTSRLLYKLHFRSLSGKIPLSYYRDKSFFIIRNDALDRFGTTLEQRFSRKQIQQMMESCGLSEISFSELPPYWHVIGRKTN